MFVGMDNTTDAGSRVYLEVANFAENRLPLAGLVLATVLFLNAARILRKPISKLPGPWYSTWTEAVLTYHWLRGNRAYYVQELHERYGSVVRISPDTTDISDVAAAREIHRVRHAFRKADWYGRFNAGATKSVFSATDVAFHRRHRRLLAAPLSEGALRAAAQAYVESRVRLAVQRVGEEMDSRGAADVFKWFLFMATDVIGGLTFGESFRMLESGKKNQYIEDLECVGQLGALRSAFPRLARLGARLPLPYMTRAGRAVRNMLGYAQESLARHARLIEAGPDGTPPTLFSAMFRERDAERLSPVEIRDDAQAFIVAGSDTTATGLTYLVWSVARRPSVRDRLVAELAALPEGGQFDADTLHELPYLNAVVDETLRLYGAAQSGLPRVVPPGGAELAGHWFPGGSTVCTQAHSLHRNPRVFPEPEKFDPSRWADATKEMMDSFMPFGGGTRVCIGIHLARMEMRMAAAHFWRTFPHTEMSTQDGMSDADMDPTIYFILSPKGKRCLVNAH